MISKEEVEHIAKLARLELTDREVEKMQKDLSAILDYFDLLKKAPKSEKENLYTPGVYKNILRADESLQQDASVVEKLIGQAPDKKDGYIKVKAIF